MLQEQEIIQQDSYISKQIKLYLRCFLIALAPIYLPMVLFMVMYTVYYGTITIKHNIEHPEEPKYIYHIGDDHIYFENDSVFVERIKHKIND